MASPGHCPSARGSDDTAAACALLRGDLVACAVLRGGRIVQASAGLCRLLNRGHVTGRTLDAWVANGDRKRVRQALDALRGHRMRVLNCSLVGTAGREIPVEMRLTHLPVDSEPGVLMAVTDLSRHVETENRLRNAAYHDALTGLPNRILLRDRLNQGIAMAARGRRLLGLIVVDLDGFKNINDRYGHAAGDTALREVARRFSSCVREEDTLARIGGDEFVVALPHIAGRESAALLAARLINSLRAPFEVEGAQTGMGSSIGIAIYPDDGTDTDTLFVHADAAMYASKRAGKNRFSFADASAGAVLAHGPCIWSEEWQLGIDEMDEQHRALFGMLNHLSETLRGTQDRTAIRLELEALLAFTAFHFATEEKIMEAARFRGLVSHRAEHRRLQEDLAELAEHTHQVGAVLTMRFLRDWLSGHMLNYDRAAAHAICKARSH